MKKASEMSRRELDDLCSQYEAQLQGPMRRHQLAINCAWKYFNSIPESERTPEQGSFEELFSEIGDGSLRSFMFEDLEIMRGEFVTPELQDDFWFDYQYLIHARAYRLKMYASAAQKVAAQYGFELPSDT
jgi:hypothetical protein